MKDNGHQKELAFPEWIESRRVKSMTDDASLVRRSELSWICREVLRSASQTFQKAEVEGSFYPYVGLTHTIRKQHGRWVIRVSDHCRAAPRPVLEAIIRILGGKILRRRPPQAALEIYDRFRQSPEIEAAIRARRLERGRKRISSSNGVYHSLQDIFGELNAQYFNGQLEVSRIGWGPRPSWGRLGHYDSTHHTITVSPVLDSANVPKSVVSYLVYHEMLHALFDAGGSSRERHHPPEFRRAEREWPGYAEAKRFLDLFCRTRGKKPQKK